MSVIVRIVIGLFVGVWACVALPESGVAQQQGVTSSFVLRVEAERGNTRSQYLLGLRYLVGSHNLPRDSDEGVRWLIRAAKAGYDLSAMALGNYFYEGVLTDPDEKMAAYYYKLAADAGNTEAQTMYGYLLSRGQGVEQNEAEAFQWFRQAALSDDVRGQYALGLAYLRGRGVRASTSRAMEWLRKASDAGSAKASFAMGVLYNSGEIFERRRVLALSFFVRALKGGYLPAVYDTSLLLLGEGVTDIQRVSPDHLATVGALLQWSLLLMGPRSEMSDPDIGDTLMAKLSQLNADIQAASDANVVNRIREYEKMLIVGDFDFVLKHSVRLSA